MSEEERNRMDAEREEILAILRTTKGLLRWVLGVAFAAVFGAAVVLISDHYDQLTLRHEMDYVKPKVERLWWKTFPDASTASNTTKKTANL